MLQRKALLIGIPNYDQSYLESFPKVVRKDISLLKDALNSSGYYQITVKGLDNQIEVTRTNIKVQIEQFFRAAKRGDTLFIHLSGHGLHFQGRDYLVPIDADLTNPLKFDDYLVRLDFAHLFEESQADTAVVFVDACRQGVKTQYKSNFAIGWGTADRQKADRQGYIMVFSCRAGQLAQYVERGLNYSLFTKALTNTLHRTHPASTFEEVLNATSDQLAELILLHEKNPQDIKCEYESEIDNKLLFSRIICDGLTKSENKASMQYPERADFQNQAGWIQTRLNSLKVITLGRFMFVLMLIFLSGSTFYLHSFVNLKTPSVNKEKILKGQFASFGEEQYFTYDAVGEINQNSIERILLPEWGSEFDLADPCHLAVLLDVPSPEKSTDSTRSRKILDLYIDSKVCGQSIDDLIRGQWGIVLDIARYPSTHLRRAERENDVSENATRQVKAIRYRQAERSIQSAIDAYEIFQVKSWNAQMRIAERQGTLRLQLKTQQFRINSVADHPKHELIHIPWGEMELTDANGIQIAQIPEFWIDRFEVSNSQFDELYRGSNWHPKGPPSFAAWGMTWREAKQYCNQLGMRLAFDVEFIKAALWNPQTKRLSAFPWGNSKEQLQRIANRNVGHIQEDLTGGSALGVLNLVGNVEEWTQMKSPSEGTDKFIVMGGSANAPIHRLLNPFKAEYRNQASRAKNLGFRCASETLAGIDQSKILAPISDRE